MKPSSIHFTRFLETHGVFSESNKCAMCVAALVLYLKLSSQVSNHVMCEKSLNEIYLLRKSVIRYSRQIYLQKDVTRIESQHHLLIYLSNQENETQVKAYDSDDAVTGLQCGISHATRCCSVNGTVSPLWGAVRKNIISDRFSTKTAVSAHI